MVLMFTLLGIFNIYILIAVLRVAKKRLHKRHLVKSSIRAFAWLVGLQLLVGAFSWYLAAQDNSALAVFYAIAVWQLIASLVILASTLRNLKTTLPPLALESYSEHDLPTVSVCIPARNESDDLQACLDSLIANNYPKLEVLVLDDCSQGKRTSEVIRSFAQAGVRFVAGEAPPNQWLAKNYAYQQLAEAANGEVLLFCGVDCRFKPDSLNVLVKSLLHKNKSMISVMPRNIAKNGLTLKNLLIQPGRYAWELALPRRILNRPPVLSTCWLIKRSVLERAGGFAAVRRKVVPESYFAKFTAKNNDAYSFMLSNETMGITTAKSFEEQQATAIRTRYPQLHRRLELVPLVNLAAFSLLVLPLMLFFMWLSLGLWLLAAMAGTSYIIQIYVYVRLVSATYRQFVPASIWMLPVAAIYDIGLLNYSMWQYEFNEVIWKGRNVCLPVMQPPTEPNA